MIDPSALRSLSLWNVGRPTGSRFKYPIEKRKTRQNTEQMQAAERNLDAFWERVDEFLIKENLVLRGSIHSMLSDSRILHRTPDWVDEPPQSAASTTNAPQAATASTQPDSKPLSQSFYNKSYTTGGSPPPPWKPTPVKIKIKTRGVAHRNNPAAAADAAQEEEEQQEQNEAGEPIYRVDKRTLDVLDSLFFVRSRGTGPGEVAWAEFIYALSQLGFEVEKLYGSVWQFSLEGQRSIQFHEPHPKSNIPWYHARRHGRRLYRAYGWHREMFILR